MIEYEPKATYWGNGLFGLCIPLVIALRDAEAGTWRQKLMQRPWKAAAYHFVPSGSLSRLLSYTTKGVGPLQWAGSSHIIH